MSQHNRYQLITLANDINYGPSLDNKHAVGIAVKGEPVVALAIYYTIHVQPAVSTLVT